MIMLISLLSFFKGATGKFFLIVVTIGLLVSAYNKIITRAYERGFSVAQAEFSLAQQKAIGLAIKATEQKNKASQLTAQAYWQSELAKKPKIQIIEKRIVEYAQAQNEDNHDTCQLDNDELLIIQDLIVIANANTPAHH